MGLNESAECTRVHSAVLVAKKPQAARFYAITRAL